MKREELIQLWMALGLIQEDETINNEMEDVGNDVFQNLVRNSLFQDVERDEYGYATVFRMHDLVHELSLSLSKPEILCLVAPKNDDIFRIPHVKHLAMYQSLEHDVQIDIASMAFKEDMTARTLHTLFFIGEIQKKISFQRFKCVRIVKFKGCRLVKIDDSIGELVHLRYLDLSYTEICVLPKSIGKLYHLQTLKLVGCRNLKDLPKEMRNLISLRYLEFQPSIPTHLVGRLINLRTLSLFRVGRETRCQIKELGGLKHLRGELNISNLEEISSKEDAAKADLFGKKNLSEFGFLWSSNKGENRNDKDVLEGLQPHGNVKSLKIKNFSGDKFSAWVAQMADDIDGRWAPLNKLVKITLSGCNSCISLRMLEDLPLLQGLVLWDMNNLTCFKSSLGEDDDVTGSMKPLSPSLRSLQLVGMKSLEKWIDGATNSSTLISPVLERLEIEDCPKIILLDECHPHPLVYLEISNCENFASVQSIEGLTSLESLAINGCPRLLELPSLHSRGHSLKKLCIVGCQELSSLPCNIFECFTFLQELALSPFSKELNSFPSLQGIEKLKNHLHSLNLYGCRHWETIPEEVQHLTSLTQFFMIGFGMGELPVWLTDMSSIRDLKFLGCKGLDKDSVKQGAPRGAKVLQLNGWHV